MIYSTGSLLDFQVVENKFVLSLRGNHDSSAAVEEVSLEVTALKVPILRKLFQQVLEENLKSRGGRGD